MLDLSHAAAVSPSTSWEQNWHRLDSKAVLSVDEADFFAKTGPKAFEEHREFERHYLRCKAIMLRDEVEHAVYMRDCSRAGMGLISPVQLFPCEQIRLTLSGERVFSLEVTRCRRVQANCYECGTVFVLK